MGPDFERIVAETLPELVQLRHELHQHPETRYEERWTSDRIARFLDAAGVSYKRGLAGGTGIVATLEGAGSKTVALRAELDALEIQEETSLPYASEIPGRMHACGHDGHLACLCGAIKTLANQADEINGSVQFLFQPAEELGGGARLLIEEGALDDVDAVFALHGWPAVPFGQVAVRPGPVMAFAQSFHMTITGEGGHGAQPATCVDPVVVAAHVTTALQTIVSREVAPWEAAVVTVAQIQAGRTSNIIPDTAQLDGTLRALDAGTMQSLGASVVRIARHTAQAFRASATVEFDEPYPGVINDPEATRLVREVAEEVLGQGNVIELAHPVMVAEDFACYLEKTPGAFFFLGVGDDAGAFPALHTPNYDFPDEAIPIGVKLLAALAFRFLA